MYLTLAPHPHAHAQAELHLTEQAKLTHLTNCAVKTKGRVDERARAIGLRDGVCVQLHNFTSLIPHGTCGGLFATIAVDWLHVHGLGVIAKMCRMIDALIISNFDDPEGNINTYEDVHHCIDGRLQQIPAMGDGDHRLTSFKMGRS